MAHAFFTQPLSRDGQEGDEGEEGGEAVGTHAGQPAAEEGAAGQGNQIATGKHRRDDEKEDTEESTGEGSSASTKRTCISLRDSDVEYFSDVSDCDDDAGEWAADGVGASIERPVTEIASVESPHDEAGDDGDVEDGADDSSCEGEDGEGSDSEPEGVSQYPGFERDLLDYEAMGKGAEGQDGKVAVVIVRDEVSKEESATSRDQSGEESYTSDEDDGDMVEVTSF
jgi:hypothetical protein